MEMFNEASLFAQEMYANALALMVEFMSWYLVFAVLTAFIGVGWAAGVTLLLFWGKNQ